MVLANCSHMSKKLSKTANSKANLYNQGGDRKEIFSLRMPDDAMVDAGINDNDFLLANPQILASA